MARRKYRGFDSKPAAGLDHGSNSAAMDWRLPSGQDLVSFALATGFAARTLLPGEEDDSSLGARASAAPAAWRSGRKR